MKILAKLSFHSIPNDLEDDEIDRRINKLYSLGYFYSVVNKDFYNPFLSRGLKGSVILTLDEQSIENVHYEFEKQKKYGVLSGEEVIKTYSEQRLNKILKIILMLAPILSLFLMIVSFVLFMLNSYLICCILIFFSDLIIKSWIVRNAFAQNIGLSELTTEFGVKYGNLISSISLLFIPCIYCVLYLLTNSFWQPLIVMGIYHFFVWTFFRGFIIRDFDSELFFYFTINDFNKYIDNNK